jgi:hypothetical protein
LLIKMKETGVYILRFKTKETTRINTYMNNYTGRKLTGLISKYAISEYHYECLRFKFANNKFSYFFK